MYDKITSKHFFIYFLIFFSISLYSQNSNSIELSETKISLEGKQYYLHTVKKGQTTYSIAKAYGVGENEIFSNNPGSEINIKTGQYLKIPVSAISQGMGVGNENNQQNDSVYIYHVTLPGENLYQIAKKYQITVDTIVSINPGTKEMVKVGTVLKIPRMVVQEETMRTEIQEKNILHVVKKDDSFFTISKKYNIPVSSILKSNKQLIWGGLKKGQVLNITYFDTIFTAPEISYVDTIDTTRFFDPYFNLLTQQDLLNLNNIKHLYTENPDIPLDIAILLPFDFKRIVELNTFIDTCKNKENVNWAKRQRIKTKKKTDFYTDFYFGCLLAADSIKKTGVSLNINVFDTGSDSNMVRYLINKHQLKNYDLVIGPAELPGIRTTLAYFGNTDTKIVLPMNQPDNLNDYSNVFQAIPSEEVLKEHIAFYIAKQSNKNIILLCNNDSISREGSYNTKQHVLRYMEYFGMADSAVIKEVYFSDTLIKTISHSLSEKDENLIVILSNDEAFVSNIARDLYYLHGNYNISLLGNPGWISMIANNNINVDYIHNLNVTYFAPFYIDYSKKEVIHFLKSFRKNFGSEPNESVKGINPVFYGYDIFLFFSQKLTARTSTDSLSNKGLLSDFEFVQKQENSGFENISVTFISYSKNFEIKNFKPYVFIKPENDENIEPEN